MYFYINRIGKGKEKRECHSSAGAASSRPADVNFACSRHSLSSCLHAKGSRYNKGPKCHPSSARGCIAVQKSPSRHTSRELAQYLVAVSLSSHY
jgi:hypothetical protein